MPRPSKLMRQQNAFAMESGGKRKLFCSSSSSSFYRVNLKESAPERASVASDHIHLIAMQSVLSSSCRCVINRPVQTRSRRQGAIKVACRADGSLNTPHSLIGCHSQVWVGGWGEKDIRKSCEGTKKAGFDLIEGARPIKLMHRLLSEPIACNATVSM